MKKALMIMYMAIAVSTAQAQSPLSFYAGRCVKMHTFIILRTKPRLSQAGALLLPKDSVSLDIRISL